jgi:hypothetical protein
MIELGNNIRSSKGVVTMKKGLFALTGIILLPAICFADTPAAETPPAPTTEAAPAKTTAPATPAPIDCQYKLPKGSDTVEQSLLMTWAQNAALQSFQFNPENIKTELAALKNCYTDQGWKAFNDALKTSGNLEAIQNNQLTVTSKVSGTAKVQNVQDKQWKVSMPLKVTYQNNDKQLLQALDVSLLIALNKSGALGIMQIIATPNQAEK